MSYSLARPNRSDEIDGLRAFSFLIVFLYHSSYLDAGYVGVDLFFILSGYLMASSVVTLARYEGVWGILTFAKKRTARLVPSILMMTATTVIFAYLIIPDSDRLEILRSALTTLIASTNYYLALSQDYFGVAAVFNPFTHMWSISAEIHFYVIIAILGFFLEFRKIWVLLFLGALIVINTAFPAESSKAYLFTHTRIISFILGCGLFWISSNTTFKPKNIGVLKIGLYSLILTFSGLKVPILVGGSEWLVNSMLVNVSGVFLIYLIVNSDVPNNADRGILLTAARASWVYIGRISYSLYLFHFPIICFFIWIFGEISPFDLIGIFLGSIVVASLNYRYIENKYSV